jgi:four helix bundle protein
LESSNKKYDLEERTAAFSSGANYIEANEAIGDKDFKMKIKTCRREAKESRYCQKD